jgi:NCAIR mutase (PurE)-related protein
MNALKEHFVHHRTYMLGCLAGALLSVIGGLVHVPVLEVGGAVICAGFCLQMIRMMAFKPKRS